MLIEFRQLFVATKSFLCVLQVILFISIVPQKTRRMRRYSVFLFVKRCCCVPFFDSLLLFLISHFAQPQQQRRQSIGSRVTMVVVVGREPYRFQWEREKWKHETHSVRERYGCVHDCINSNVCIRYINKSFCGKVNAPRKLNNKTNDSQRATREESHRKRERVNSVRSSIISLYELPTNRSCSCLNSPEERNQSIARERENESRSPVWLYLEVQMKITISRLRCRSIIRHKIETNFFKTLRRGHF